LPTCETTLKNDDRDNFKKSGELFKYIVMNSATEILGYEQRAKRNE
jgi:hypothetical protein